MHSLNYLSSKGRAAIVCFPGIFYRKRKDKEYFSRYVDKEEIAGNDYNLSVSTYVEKEDTREKMI